MSKVILYTDKFPYGKGESFIENEIEYLANRFREINIFPLGLSVNTDTRRFLPNNFKVIPPVYVKDLYQYGKPNLFKKIIWTARYMLIWIIASFFSKLLYSEMFYLIKNRTLTFGKIQMIFRALSPQLRNKFHYRQKIINIINCDEDIIIYHYWLSPSILVFNNLYKNNISRKISRAHRIDLYANESKNNYIPFQKKVVEIIDFICPISQDGEKYLIENFKIENKIKRFYLGTYDKGYNLHSKRTPFHIVSCSYVIPVKRIEMILEMLILSNDQDIIWTHIGGGIGFDNLKSRILNQNHLRNKINLLGHINNTDVVEFYKNNEVHAFINVSLSEGLPVSIMEACSFGIPIICTDVGGSSEIVKNDYNGFLIKKDSTADNLLDTIIRLKSLDNDIYLNMRKNARNIWEENFNTTKNSSAFVDFMERKYL